MNNDNPKVTVLMPVYNGEKYLREAIQSILTQTFTDFEFLIINDGSTDKSLEIIKSFHDVRIRLVSNEINLKLIATLNKGLDLAQGKYVARMDSDDVSLPTRLQKQVDFMEKNTDTGVCGSWIKYIGEEQGECRFPTDSSDIMAHMFFDSVLAHPSVIMRKEMLDINKLRYDPEHLYVEDFGLWQRCSEFFNISNMPEVLLHYRVLSTSICRSNETAQSATLAQLANYNLAKLGIKIDDMILCGTISRFDFPKTIEYLRKIENLLQLIKERNNVLEIYPLKEFVQVIRKRWFLICYHSGQMGMSAWQIYNQSSFSKNSNVAYILKMKFLVKCLIRK